MAILRYLLFASFVTFAALMGSAPVVEAQTLRSLSVPLDYSHPNAGSASLAYELGASFDAHKPTVIVVADGQQFYISAGQTAELQRKLFGPDVNVVGLITRGT